MKTRERTAAPIFLTDKLLTKSAPAVQGSLQTKEAKVSFCLSLRLLDLFQSGQQKHRHTSD